MTPLFGPKPAPPGIAFGPGYGEHQPGGWRAQPNVGWPTSQWQGGFGRGGIGQDGLWQSASWQGGGWPPTSLEAFGQFLPRQGPGLGGFGPGGFSPGGLGGFRR